MPGNGMKCVLILWISISWCYGSCPLSCVCIESMLVNCSNAGLTEIPSEIDQSEPVKLDLSFNQIKTISGGAIIKFKEINFSFNKIQNAQFEYSEDLTKLNFSHNYISNTHDIDILQLVNLEFLDISSNKILNPRFPPSKSLKELDISFNNITQLDDGFFNHSPNLTKLIISNNNIKNLTGFNSKTLETLDVSNCLLLHLTRRNLAGIPNLKKLNAANNKQLKLSLDGHCLELETADFSKTSTSEIFINSLCKIRHVSFSFNSISVIQMKTFVNNIYLNSLNLSFNNIYKIETKSFLNNTEIHIIDVSNNYLESLEWSKYLKEVKFFNASHNRICYIDNLILYKSESIDLSKNEISYLQTSFFLNIPLVEYLNLRYNSIDHVQPLISNSLKYLILSYCQITILNENTFSELKQLKFLDLEGNKLKTLNYKIFDNVPTLIQVKLDHNTWSCNCDSQQFRDLIIYLIYNNTITDSSSLYCDDENIRWTEKCIKVIPAPNKGLLNVNVALGVGCFFLVAIGILAAIVYFKAKIFHNDDDDSSPVTTINPQRLLRTSSQTDTPRESVNNERESQLPPPSYEEALLMPPLTEVERITRSREVLNC